MNKTPRRRRYGRGDRITEWLRAWAGIRTPKEAIACFAVFALIAILAAMLIDQGATFRLLTGRP